MTPSLTTPSNTQITSTVWYNKYLHNYMKALNCLRLTIISYTKLFTIYFSFTQSSLQSLTLNLFSIPNVSYSCVYNFENSISLTLPAELLLNDTVMCNLPSSSQLPTFDTGKYKCVWLVDSYYNPWYGSRWSCMTLTCIIACT